MESQWISGPSDSHKPVESLFAEALEQYHLDSSPEKSPFDLVGRFKSIAATEALRVGEALTADTTSDLLEEFENWDLETKLWDLVEILGSFRASEQPDLLDEDGTLAVKHENHLRKHPQLRELALVIQWLRNNTRTWTPEEQYSVKWEKTKLAALAQDYNVLTKKENRDTEKSFIDAFDVDAPLRTNKSIHPDDESVDSANFRVVYKLLLADKVQEAIDFASNTGNYALALILVGAAESLQTNETCTNQSGQLDSHRLWKKTVFQLSQRSLNKYERLIYNYLSGGDITPNIEEASDDWEECLLLYASQLLSYQLESLGETSVSPSPRFASIEEILNALQNTGTQSSSRGGNHPLRIIMGGVIVNKVPALLHSIVASMDVATKDVVMRPFLARVTTHLAIFQQMVSDNGNFDITAILTLYVSRMAEYRLYEGVPIYLEYVPKEEDAREVHSLFLSTLTTTEDRQRQIAVSRRLANRVTIDENDLVVVDDTQNARLVNVLRRTVERVMADTEEHYRPSDNVVVQAEESPMDPTDVRLTSSLEWFYDNDMYEDAIVATITVIRRLLLCGRIVSLREFARSKNFKKLIRDYDAEQHRLSLTGSSHGQVSEEHKSELKEYGSFVDGLVLICDWKRFRSTQTLWESSGVGNSIEKVTSSLCALVSNWFINLIDHSAALPQTTAIFRELRNMYVPNLVMELMDVYQSARFKDWSYMREALDLVNRVADDGSNDLMACFVNCGRLDEFMGKVGEVSVVAVEKGLGGLFETEKNRNTKSKNRK